jgi:NADPH:quinone reductase
VRAIQISEFGGPEVLTLVEVPDPVPTGERQVLSVESAGVNYADTHQVENSYLSQQQLPMIPGGEVVGRRDDGQRVSAFVTGGYAEKALAHPAAMFEVPDAVDNGQALALLAQGLTAWHLLRTYARLQEGDSVVVHAAAGGVGTLAVQLAKRFGAGRVIAVASTEEKRALAMELGADAGVDAGAADLKAALQEANGGSKVDVVLEMTGGPTFDASLAALAPLGRMVTYGQASRQPPTPIEPAALMARSLTVSGFWLVHLLTRPHLLHGPMIELFGMVSRGDLRVIVGAHYPLEDAAKAHHDLRSRTTIGKLVLDALPQ